MGGKQHLIRKNFLFPLGVFLLLVLLTVTGVGAADDPAEGKVPVVTAENFQAAVMESSLPVLVQFHAEWCPYCRAVQPGLQALSAARRGKLQVFKVDIDQDPELAQRFKVESIPHFVLLNAGEIMEQSEKVMRDGALQEWADKILSRIPSSSVAAPAL